ncbi:error-prone DNA polymerase [Sphingomicrobium flavum]|uniref:error-prone DNA polymerase n=1 Tax=Sphingomicrobium flavum TaxID=1229164 RepID=UPI0021AE11B3|nr:error-prone DNA polymerase [Sphingomicrobium flavum]
MPDQPLTPDRRTLARLSDRDFTGNPRAEFVELGLMSCFSFLRGASDAVDLVLTAFAQGYDAIGIADLNTLAGVVRIHSEATTAKMRPVIGCRIATVEGWQFLAYPVDRAAYGRLSSLLSKGKMATLEGEWQDKGETHIDLSLMAAHQEGLQLVLIPPTRLDSAFEAGLGALAARLASLSHIAAAFLYRGDDVARINRLDALAKANGLELMATNLVRYHAPERRPLQDIMTCIREKTTIDKAGLILAANAERYLKSPAEMVRLFARWPHAIKAARAIADACNFNLTELAYEYPDEPIPADRTPDEQLRALAEEGARWRYPDGVPHKVKGLIARELALIAKLNIARYFLTIKDIIDFARGCEPPILCQGRGSAANSAVCYCLGITAVDPDEHELLFDRFISEERKEPPDIDVDFEHERREEVIQYIYRRYGRHRAGLCATVIHYRPRMAIREVGKVMGLSEDTTSALARTVWGSYGKEIADKHAAEAGLDMSDPQLRRVLKLTEQMIGMPRHLSQHVGGFILTQGPLTHTVPIGNGAMPERSFIEWDKDDIDALGILKIDVLALGMLTCLQKGFDLLRDHHHRDLTLATCPREDPRVYDMLVKGDSLGVFQVESRAQMNMLPRLKPRKFYDLVIEVAIVRPGPIQGDMVHPYLKRRRGAEPVIIPKPSSDHGPPDELSSILGRTLGVPIFQEQAMKIALDAAKFSSVEANQLRKAMATFRSRGMVDELQDKMVGRMIERGYDPEFAARCFQQIRGFGEYGFPESHAASFAHLVYVSSWMKCHYPAVFACALLNSQPMGFYAPAQIVRDAQEHGVEVRAADVNDSGWDNSLEAFVEGNDQPPMRLGLRQVEGLREVAAARLVAERDRAGPYASLAELHERTRLSSAVIERLAAADAFRSMGLDRRQALWDARALKSAIDLPLFAAAAARDEGAERAAHMLPQMPLPEHVVADYQTMRLSLKAHPMSFLRDGLSARGFTANADLRKKNFRQMAKVSGIVLIRQRPGSAKGVCFITLEDETGVVNLVVWPDVMEKYRKVIMGARLMEVSGRIEMDDEVLHLIVGRMEDATWRLGELSHDLLNTQISRADEVNRPLRTMSEAKHKVEIIPEAGNADCAPRAARRTLKPADPRSPLHQPMRQTHPRNARILPKSRDFH